MLRRLEALGNRLPDPLILFVLMALAVVAFSAMRAGTSVPHPATGDPVVVQSLLDTPMLRRMFTDAVKNFSGFPPLGTVLVAMMGIGLAERTGFLGAALSGSVRALPPWALTVGLLFVGINSSIAADAGFVVLVPLGAALYATAGRHPLAGMAVAYASVSGGFGANVVIIALDPMLAGLTEAAARLVTPDIKVAATCNWFFNVASVGLLTVLGAGVARWTEPSFGPWTQDTTPDDGADRSLLLPFASMAAWMGVVGVLVAAGVLRNGADLTPLYDSVVLVVAAAAFFPGLVYGLQTGSIRTTGDLAARLGEAIAGMGGYIVLAFAAAQFVAWFGWSNLGVVTAVEGASFLRPLGLSREMLLTVLVGVSGVVNILIASASAKWAIMAPVFVPMGMLLGIAPAETQAAYRVGDAVTNVVTPLMPYVPIVLATARRYVPTAGLGTVLAAQVPWMITFGLGWTTLLFVWISMRWPLGPGA